MYKFIAVLSLFFAVNGTFAQKNSIKKQEVKHNKQKNTSISHTDSIIAFAKKQIGVPYKYAGSSPKTGFDCSGFVNYVFTKFGYKVPRRSRDFKNVGRKIKLNKCKKGDIILFAGYNIKKRPIGHVGIIVENNNGKIKFIHSATSKHRGVVISNYNKIKYYTKRFAGIRRLIKE